MDISLNDVYEKIAEASIYGNLGMFAGAGFSKAVLKGSDFEALDWGELLKASCENLNVDPAKVLKKNLSYPEVASKFCALYAKKKDISFYDATICLKQEIARLTNWFPTEKKRQIYYAALTCLRLNWIITTNYDLLLETVLSGKGLSLGPSDQLINPRHMVPIYHLHGIRLDPSSMIITQEDYISLFRPSEYRQVKLPLLLKESTVLLVGYGLGDINVLTAIDWSNNVFKMTGLVNYPHNIIQVLYAKDDPNPPYFDDKNNIIIAETNDIENFFAKVCEVISERQQSFEKKQQEIDAFNEQLTKCEKNLVIEFIDDAEARQAIIGRLIGVETYLTSGFLTFLNAVIDETKERASSPGSFNAYNQRLKIILDILIAIDVEKMPPALFNFLATSFEELSSYIGRGMGESWNANDTWKGRRSLIPPKTIEEMKKFYEIKWWQPKVKALLDF